MRKSFLISLFVSVGVLVSSAQAQETIYEETMVVYKHQWYGGLNLHTAGWGLNFSLLKNKTAFKARVLKLEIVGLNSHKQVKSFNPFYEDARGYFYGKQFSFYVIRPTWGFKKVLHDKIRKNGVEVGYSWSVGPSLGLAKPVYLEILRDGPTSTSRTINVERYDVNKHFHEDIYGRASGMLGWGEVEFYPGLHGRFGLIFEFASQKTAVTALEAGVAIDGYGKKIPIMALEDSENRQVFLNLYLNLMLGKKYNKTK